MPAHDASHRALLPDPLQAGKLTCMEGDTFPTISAGGLQDSVGRTSVMISEWFVDTLKSYLMAAEAEQSPSR